MNEILDKIEQLTEQFGAEIIVESRFVNMFNDLYPSRKNPAVSHILKNIVIDGHSVNLLKINKKKLNVFVNKTASDLCTKYGFEESLVIDILYYLAIGTNRISLSDYLIIKNTGTKPQPNTISPKPTAPSQKSKAPKSNNKIGKSFKFIKKHFLDLLILGLWLLVLTITPFIYGAVTQSWWPFPSILVVGFVNLMFYIGPSERFQKNDPDSLFRGGQMAIYFCSIVFFLIGPFICCTEIVSTIFHHYGILPNQETPSVFSLVLSCFYSAMLLSIIATFDEPSLFNKIKTDRWRKGFIYMLILIVLIGLTFLSYPFIRSFIYKQKIIKKNETTISLREKRLKNLVSLSFKDFSLGDDIRQYTDTLLHKDYQLVKYDTITHNNTLLYNLTINSRDFLPIVQSVATIDTEWDNSKVTASLFSINDTIVAISVNSDLPADSIVNMYISKYGEAETPIINYKEMSFLSLPWCYLRLYDSKYHIIDYSWTFSNAEIHIEGNYDLFDPKCKVTYFDRKCISILDNIEKREEQMRKKLERMENEKKRKQNEEVKIQQEKERKRIIQNHEKSLDQI